jgi:iron complex outermembrane receptor protein
MINDATDNNIFGTDLEFDYMHKLFSQDANLVGGVTSPPILFIK